MSTTIDLNSSYYSPKRTTSKDCPERPKKKPIRSNMNSNLIFTLPFPNIDTEISSIEKENSGYLTPLKFSGSVLNKKVPDPPRKIKKRILEVNNNIPQTYSFNNLKDLFDNSLSNIIINDRDINNKKKIKRGIALFE